MELDLDRLLTGQLSRRRFLRMSAAGAGFAAISGLLAACGDDDDDDDDGGGDTTGDSDEPTEADTGTEAEGEPKSGGTLVWAMGGDADALDPHTTSAWAAWRQSTMMYESLVRKDLLTDEIPVPIVPQLAESWEVTPDGKTWTFKLREGVKFHDGADFNAEAVMANYERNAVEDSEYYFPNAWHGIFAFQFAESVEAPNEFTWTITHTRPVVEFLATIGDYYWFGIASPTRMKEVGAENLAQNPAGTGPFRFVERVEGQRTVFERNEDYWGEKAYLDEVIIRPVLEDQARVVALQTGEVDLMSDPPPDVIESLVNEGYVLSQGLASQVAFYRFQYRNEFGGNQKVRQAVQYAVDREAIARDLFRDTAIPAYGVLAPGAPGYEPDWAPYEYDPDRARQLLAEAGYPDGFKTMVQAPPTASGWPQAGAVAQFIKDNLADVGIEVELKLTEWVTYLGIEWREEVDTMMWGTAWGMPTNFFLNVEAESAYRSESDQWDPGYSNRENPNEELDELLIQGAQETDPEKSNELYRKANAKLCVEDAARFALTHDKLPHLMRPEVKGFVHAVNVNYDLSKVWLDE